MSNDITTSNAYTAAVRPNHLAVVAGGPAAAEAAAPASQTRPTGGTGTAYGRPIETGRPSHEMGVRAVACMFQTFEEALLPMVLASGVAGEAAPRVAEAIMSSPAMRKQAEAAFRTARVSAVPD